MNRKTHTNHSLKQVLLHFLCLVTAFTMLSGLSLTPITAQAQIMEGYSNPQDIIIASPTDMYTTTSEKVSILGACDYNYPLYMNGVEIEKTSLGFFTQYVTLALGTNTFNFMNNGKVKVLTIIRKEKTTGSGETDPEDLYKAYTVNYYGTLNNSYTMPRTSIWDSDVDCMPLTKGTSFKILGKQGSYYKIFDGTFIHKSYVDTYKGTLTDNKVTKVTVTDDLVNNLIVAKLTMNVNALYKVETTEDKVVLTLYETITTPKATLQANDTVKRVVANIYAKTNRTVVYTFKLYDNAMITGYDATFKDGAMYFYLKKAPHLKEVGSLKGATILLDAGHGNYETGALGPLGKFGPVEKDINLNITLYTKTYLEEMGAKVVLTRSDDSYYSLSSRVAAIRALKPDLSLSIHANAMPQAADFSLSKGFLSLYSCNETTDAQDLINDSIISKLGAIYRESRQQSLSLTRITSNPAVLIETAFMSYPEDYEYLIQLENQQTVAKATAEAIQEYLESTAVYGPTIYIVQKGDSLASIAIKFKVKLKALITANNITDINYIYVGQKLIIP